MNNIKTNFAGLDLQNPIIISSSSLTNSAEKNLALEKAGAAAVVLKSIFEEQILLQSNKEMSDLGSSVYGMEGENYIFEYIKNHTLSEYLDLIRDTKKVCSIPVIASMNCYSEDGWLDFAREIENAGADAIELNIMMLPTSKNVSYMEYEIKHAKIVENLTSTISIPVVVKLANNIGNISYVVNSIMSNGAKGVVLFNKLYPFDIDIDNLNYTKGDILGHKSDLSNGLRWTGILSSQIDGDYAISGGVQSGEDVIKSILCGASAVEICTVLYKNKAEDVLPQMLNDINKWMDSKNFESISDFKGRMKANEESMSYFERTQFLKYFHS